MSLSNKLCNATGFKRQLDYERGITITVPPDGSVSLTVSQMDDFREGKAGSEEARLKLASHGLFLEDGDRGYDVQALEALRRCSKYLTDRYESAVQTLQDMHVAANIDANIASPQFQAKLKTMGLLRLKEELAAINKRIETYREAVGEDFDDPNAPVVPKLDPERTCFVIDPPREFPSKTALHIFLQENPKIKEAHEQWVQTAQAVGDENSTEWSR